MAANEVIKAEDLHQDVSFPLSTSNIMLNRDCEADFQSQSSVCMPSQIRSTFEKQEEIVDLEQRRVDSTT